jgi:hypothetical protein
MRFQAVMAAGRKFIVFWDVLPCSEIVVDLDIYFTTRQCIPEDSEL